MIKNVLKTLYSWFNKPYMATTITYRKDGSIAISSVYNQQFIMDLDFNYQQVKNPDYNPLLSDRVKVSYFLADNFNGLTEQYLGSSPLSDDEARPGDDPLLESLHDAPDLRGNGVRDVVDIANMRLRS